MENNVVTINVREFARHITRYLKQCKYVVTKHDKPYLVVTIETAIDKKEIVEELKNDVGFVPNFQRETLTYGCGCVKTTDFLCGKHQRA